MAKYIRSGATGAGTGADWTNAYTDLPATFTRGETYYVADGSYGSHDFTTAESGSTYITIKKATSSDHGISTGWSSSYGTGEAVFTPRLNFRTSYWKFDGVTGGGPGSWDTGHGFVVDGSGWGNTPLVIIGYKFVTATQDVNYVQFSHVAFRATAGYWTGALDMGSASGRTNSNITVSYCYLPPEIETARVQMGGVTVNNLIIEKTYFKGAKTDVAHHFTNIRLQSNTEVDLRYNLFEDWLPTGCIGAYERTMINVRIYGNVFWNTPGYTTGSANGTIYTVNSGSATLVLSNWRIYNNSFVNIYQYTIINLDAYFGSVSGCIAKNNIFYNCNATGTPMRNGVTSSYNWFYPAVGETASQTGTGNPFVSWTTKNFHLTSGTNAGDSSIGSTYNTDPDGVSRLIDGVWDRGAYEYDTGGSPGDIISPSVQILTPTTNDRWSKQSNSIGISGSADDNIAVTSVTWSNNLGGSGTATGTTSWVIPSITLYAGDNIITVTAWDAAGNSGTDTLTVIYPGTDILYGHAVYIH